MHSISLSLRFSVESREGKPRRKDCWLLAEAGSALNVYICWRKEGRLFRFACSLRVWTIFAFTFLYQYSKTWHRGFKLDPRAVFYPSADQSVLALYGKIVFFATKFIQGTFSPTFLLMCLEALVWGLEYFLIIFFSDEISKVKLTDFLWPHRFCPSLLHWCNKLF